jgi:hypothetical protein
MAEKLIYTVSNSSAELFEWPANIAIHIFDRLSQENEREEEKSMELIERIITELPSFADLDLPEELHPSYKKSKHIFMQVSRSY